MIEFITALCVGVIFLFLGMSLTDQAIFNNCVLYGESSVFASKTIKCEVIKK